MRRSKSKVFNLQNFFQVAIYFEPDQSVITKITKDAKMTWSDKISWVRKHKQKHEQKNKEITNIGVI